MREQHAKRVRHYVTERHNKRKRKRHAVPFVYTHPFFLGFGEPERLIVRLRKLNALTIALQQRYSKRFCDGFTLRLREQQHKRFTVSHIFALIPLLGFF
jgi:hypothetical protein